MLLYTADDVERQFGMAARSRLTREEIQGILRALNRLDTKNRKHRVKGDREPRVEATVGEILTEDQDRAFERDSDDRRQSRADCRGLAGRGAVTSAARRTSCASSRHRSR